MEFWIARDKAGTLWIFADKPKKIDDGDFFDEWQSETLPLFSGCFCFDAFSEVKWEDAEPKRVKIELIDE